MAIVPNPIDSGVVEGATMIVETLLQMALEVLTIAAPEVLTRSPVKTSPDLLHVRVYDFASVSRRSLDGALAEMSRILAAAGVRAVWHRGNLEEREGYTVDMTAPNPGSVRLDKRAYLAVRIVRGFPEDSMPGVLGLAVPAARSGVHVTIFYDRVEKVRLTDATMVPNLLGDVVAHEIGHVLLQSREHSRSGLMKAAWTRADFHQLAYGALGFDRRQAAVIRAEVARRGR